MLTATCHCGAVRVTVPRKARTVTDCNCSICRRYGYCEVVPRISGRSAKCRPAPGRRSRWLSPRAHQ